jgi:enterobacterial common antigen flippase
MRHAAKAAAVASTAGDTENVAHWRKASYRRILRSSALIGSSSVLTILVGVVRAKTLAALLGPAGLGLMDSLNSLVDLVRGVAAMGINSSGVRQIAAAVAGGNQERVARTAFILRRSAIILGTLGAVAMLMLAHPIARLTFGDAGHAVSVSLLAVAVFCRVVADGQGALLQGMRMIADMARSQVFGALLGTIVAVLLVWGFGMSGVAPALVALSAMLTLVTFWYVRKVRLPSVSMDAAQMVSDARQLLTLGIAFMCSSVMMMGAAYAVRLVVIRNEGLVAGGLFAAAWTLGGIYVNMVLQAMSADYYPRLVGLVGDDRRTNQLVDDQTHVSLLLAGSGVLATLTLAPQALWLFYSGDFTEAASTLRWICLGMAVRVFTYPIGYVIVARNDQRLFITVEVAWAAVNVGLTWLAVRIFGLEGAGIAFFGSYLFHGLLVYPIVQHLTGYRLSDRNKRLALLVFGCASLTFAASQFLSPGMALVLGCAGSAAMALYCIANLVNLATPARLPPGVRRLVDAVAALRERIGQPR